MSYEQFASESKKAFDGGDFVNADALRRNAQEAIGTAYRVVQMSDGELQAVPVEG